METKGIIIHSKANCNYCIKSKELLSSKNIPYTEIVLDPENIEKYTVSRNELILVSKGHITFPWIFINGDFLGGFHELSHSFCGNTEVIKEKLKNTGIVYLENENEF